MRPLYIFDLDGTLANCEHRQHLIQGDKKDWRAFFAACTDDAPIPQTILTLRMLRDSGAVIWIWTGRSEEVRFETEAWLHAWGIGTPAQLRMRPKGDFQQDHTLKASWLADMEPEERIGVIAVFEDRDQVVSMWRAAGVPCFQVAPGNF